MARHTEIDCNGILLRVREEADVEQVARLTVALRLLERPHMLEDGPLEADRREHPSDAQDADRQVGSPQSTACGRNEHAHPIQPLNEAESFHSRDNRTPTHGVRQHRVKRSEPARPFEGPEMPTREVQQHRRTRRGSSSAVTGVDAMPAAASKRATSAPPKWWKRPPSTTSGAHL